MKISILDVSPIGRCESVTHSFAASVALTEIDSEGDKHAACAAGLGT
jgi:hypothetical protein